MEFLRQPHRVRPSGRMPDLRLPGQEIERIAHYLLRGVEVPGHLAYTRHRGRVWEGLDADEVEADQAGHVADFDLDSFRDKHHNSAIVYEGYLKIEVAGEHTFHLEMNGGVLTLNDEVVIEQEASNRRGVKKAKGGIHLAPGWNKIHFVYFHTGRDPRLSFEMEGPGFERGPIPSERLSVSDGEIAAFEPWTVDAAKAAAGRARFAKLGCARCHDDLKVEDTSPVAGALATLDRGMGCLSGTVGSWPRFDLSPAQRASLAAAVPGADADRLSDEQRVAVDLVSLNCIACHERERLGGVGPERNEHFTGTKPELGKPRAHPAAADARRSEAAAGVDARGAAAGRAAARLSGRADAAVRRGPGRASAGSLRQGR